MVVHTIELVEGHDLILNETKLSSSAMRRAAFGSILREPGPTTQKLLPDANIYIIGLTGGICAGKSTISRYLTEHYSDIFQVFNRKRKHTIILYYRL